jgi:hypothetical protein
MTLKDTDIATVRSLLLFLVGVSCLTYAILAIAKTHRNLSGGIFPP